jgi:hypothetical protein
MAIAWTNFNNGETNLNIRTALNTFNTSAAATVNINTNAIATLDSEIAVERARVDTTILDVTALDTRADTAEADIVALENANNTYGSLYGQTSPIYNLTTTFVSLVDYVESIPSANVVVNAVSGTIKPTTGGTFLVGYTGDISFTSSTTTRALTLKIKNVTDNTDGASGVIVIPREATRATETLMMMLPLTANKEYRIDVASSEAMIVTFNALNFFIKYVGA